MYETTNNSTYSKNVYVDTGAAGMLWYYNSLSGGSMAEGQGITMQVVIQTDRECGAPMVLLVVVRECKGSGQWQLAGDHQQCICREVIVCLPWNHH
jgi:hypothetical protein